MGFYNIKYYIMLGVGKNVEKAQELIKFHEPYERLQFRIEVQTVLRSEKIIDKIPSEFDIFSIIDAIAKRGGPEEVMRRHRLEEIALSFPYYNFEFLKIYQDFIIPYEHIIFRKLTKIPVITYEPFIQHHLLPVKESSFGYERTPEEIQIVSDHFNSLDEYYNIKHLAYYKCDYNKIPSSYIPKLFIVKKWLFLTGLISLPPPKELKVMGFHNLNMKIGIIGFSLSNIVLAYRLGELGIKVKIFDNNEGKSIAKLREGNLRQVIKQSPFFSESSEPSNQIIRILSILGLHPQKIKVSGINMLRQDGSLHSPEMIEKTEQIFFDILNEILLDGNSKEVLELQIEKKIKKRKMHAEKELILWQLFRYMLFTKIKKQFTLVADLKKYLLKSQKLKILHEQTLLYFPYEKNPSVYSQLSSKVQLSTNAYLHVEYLNKGWKVQSKNSEDELVEEEFTHIIFSDSEKILNSISSLNYKIPEIRGEMFREGFPIFQQLNYQVDHYYLFRFKEKISFKDSLSGSSNFITVKYPLGRVHFILLKSGYEVFGITDGKSNSYDSYDEVLLLLMSKVLKKNSLLQEGLVEKKIWFNIRDECFMNSLMKIRENEKIYFNFPVHSFNHQNEIYSQQENNNYLFSVIVKGISKLNYFDERQFYELKNRKQTIHKEPENLQKKNEEKKIKTNKINAFEDFMGRNHTITKSHSSFVLSQLQTAHQITNSLLKQTPLSKIPLLNLTEPIELYPDIWLHSFGEPYLMKNGEWYTNNNHVCRRLYYSISNPNKAVIYYECVVMIKDKEYFCIVEQNEDNSIVYYHRNEKYLNEKFNETIEQKRQKAKKDQFRRTAFSYSIPSYIFPSILKSIIIEEEKAVQGKNDQFLHSKLSGQFSSIKCAEVFFRDPVAAIVKECQSYLRSILILNNIKRYSLGEFFVGKMNEMFLVAEIMGMFHSNLTSVEEIAKNDRELASQIQKILAKQKTQYHLVIEQKIIKRNFLSHSISSSTHSYYEFDYGQDLPTFEIEKNGKYNEWMKEVIKVCGGKYGSQETIKRVREMINEEIEGLRSMGEKLKYYFKMTRIQKMQVNSQSVKKMKAKITELETENRGEMDEERLTDGEIEVILEKYREGKLSIIGGEVVCLF